MELSELKYNDELDKSYGLAGMVISLVASDGEELLSEISMDAPAGESLVMSHDYFFSGNPRMSAKVVWSATLEHFRLSTSMLLGNVMCRRYVLRRLPVDRATSDCLRELVCSEAGDSCALERDEADALFDRCYSYVDRLFSHNAVHSMAVEFSEILRKRRSLSAQEALETLNRLGNR